MENLTIELGLHDLTLTYINEHDKIYAELEIYSYNNRKSMKIHLDEKEAISTIDKLREIFNIENN